MTSHGDLGSAPSPLEMTVSLVSMPFKDLRHPPIQLGILERSLASAGIAARSHSPELAFILRARTADGAEGERLSIADHQGVAHRDFVVHLGEWIFKVPPSLTSRLRTTSTWPMYAPPALRRGPWRLPFACERSEPERHSQAAKPLSPTQAGIPQEEPTVMTESDAVTHRFAHSSKACRARTATAEGGTTTPSAPRRLARRHLIAIMLLLLFCTPVPHYAQTANTTTAQDRGKSIGTIVSSAIDAALPGIGTLAKAIIGIFKPSAKPDDPQVKAATAASKQQTTDSTKAANDKLSPVSEVADELRIVNGFTSNSVVALYNLAQVVDLAARKPINWTVLRAKWGSFKGPFHSALKSATAQDVSMKVKDLYVRSLIQKIFNLDDTVVNEADTYIKDGSDATVADLQTALSALREPLTDLSLAASIELDRLASDIGALAKTAKGAQSTQEPFGPLPTKLETMFTERQAAVYPKSKRIQ
jgi:hypothetical protein